MSERGIIRELNNVNEQLNNYKKKDLFEKIVKATPLIYGFLIFCGALYSCLFYLPFGINIFKYLELTEILISFIHVIISSISTSISPPLICFVIMIILFEIISFFLNEENKFKYKEIADIFARYLKIYPGIIILGLGFYITRFFNAGNVSENILQKNSYDTIASLVMGISAAVLVFLYGASDKNHFIKNLIVTVLLCTVYQSYSDAKLRISISKTQKVTITTKDSLITTDTNYVYLERTNNYIFLYDVSDKRCDVIPVTEIKKISFK